MKNLKSIIIIVLIFVVLAYLAVNMNSNFIDNDNLLDDKNLLQKKTRIWGDLNDDTKEIIKRMTEPDIGFYPSKMKLFDYYDIIT